MINQTHGWSDGMHKIVTEREGRFPWEEES